MWEPPSHLGYVILSGVPVSELPGRHQAGRVGRGDGIAGHHESNGRPRSTPNSPVPGALHANRARMR